MRRMGTKIYFTICLLFSSLGIFGQIYDPVQWSFSTEDLGNGELLLVYEADIESGWAVYSQYLESDEGPVATSLNYESTELFDLIGDAVEKGNKKEGYDALFAMNVTKFYDEYRIEQRIKLKESGSLTGYLNFMTCDDTKCLPPKDVDFIF